MTAPSNFEESSAFLCAIDFLADHLRKMPATSVIVFDVDGCLTTQAGRSLFEAARHMVLHVVTGRTYTKRAQMQLSQELIELGYDLDHVKSISMGHKVKDAYLRTLSPDCTVGNRVGDHLVDCTTSFNHLHSSVLWRPSAILLHDDPLIRGLAPHLAVDGFHDVTLEPIPIRESLAPAWRVEAPCRLLFHGSKDYESIASEGFRMDKRNGPLTSARNSFQYKSWLFFNPSLRHAHKYAKRIDQDRFALLACACNWQPSERRRDNMCTEIMGKVESVVRNPQLVRPVYIVYYTSRLRQFC